MKGFVKLLPLIMVLLCGVLTAQQIGSLDIPITSRKRLREPGGIGGGSCGGVEHAHYPEAAVSLLSLDNTQYEFGQDVAFEIKIQNVGKDPIILPWGGELADFEPTDRLAIYTYLQGTVSLHFVAKKRELPIYSSFYGSTLHVGTLKDLEPGEWVIVRGQAKLEAFDGSFSPAFGNNDFVSTEVGADFMLNKVTFLPKGEGGKPRETSSCVNVRTQRANQLKSTIFRRMDVR